jgi:hypothetical protein
VIAESPAELEQVITSLLKDGFPDELERQADSRWNEVRSKLAAAGPGGTQAAFADFAEWIAANTPAMEQPNGGETRERAAARLVYFIARYVHDDRQPVKEIGSDAAFGVVRPAKAVTIVTPARTAGVALPQGAVSEPIVVVVAQNTKAFKDACRGPLDTRMCQYPLFYRFESFPVVRRLNRPGRFGVCHITKGSRKPTDEVHERVALGHSGPADGSTFSEGARRVDRIELPKPVDVTDFMYCKPDHVEYDLATAAGQSWLGWASAVLSHLGPRLAYARRIDQGVGGEGHFFDDYNVVDPKSGGDQ